jgi:hypothetical protein
MTRHASYENGKKLKPVPYAVDFIAIDKTHGSDFTNNDEELKKQIKKLEEVNKELKKAHPNSEFSKNDEFDPFKSLDGSGLQSKPSKALSRIYDRDK